MLRRELDAAVGLAGADDRNVRDGCGSDLQSSSLKKRPSCDVRPVRHSLRSTSRYSGRIVVAIAEILVARHRPICRYSNLFQPETMFTPNRPLLMPSIVDVILAMTAGCMVGMATEA